MILALKLRSHLDQDVDVDSARQDHGTITVMRTLGSVGCEMHVNISPTFLILIICIYSDIMSNGPYLPLIAQVNIHGNK